MKVLLVGAEPFHTDGRTDRRMYRRTDMTKLIVAFCTFTYLQNVLATKNFDTRLI